jgi:rare lipoprotein A (peptidoglycan hydrolase)
MATAQDGGVATPGTRTHDTTYSYAAYGARDLALGMRGDDVKTLNWILKSQTVYDRGVPLVGEFEQPTDESVKSFQGAAGLSANGVVSRDTRKALARRMPARNATWYGPGFFGKQTACGKTLKKTTIGVAHKKLPCGTRVTFAYLGHYVRAKVIDRGPYRKGYKWDLTKKLAKRLGFLAPGGPTKVRAAIVWSTS